MTEKVGKRARKANFSAEEVRILLEELQVEHVTLFSSHSATITSEMKKEIWQRITSKVNACGVAVRTLTDLKEKWRALKASVLNKKRDEAKTGGGPAPAPVPYEEVILSIIGDKSNLFSGVTGEDDNSTAGFDIFGEPSNVSVLPDTLHSGKKICCRACLNIASVTLLTVRLTVDWSTPTNSPQTS
ncbi:t-SNARE domain-containing protein 1-like [Babylonia areolata]|uniref:t-SNARE domain-containing protein 1-like n=1 Tax=Babylonia areolata TaxID=304850 RepID=UPI003FD4A0BE